MSTSKGSRADNARAKRRKWVLALCCLPLAALAALCMYFVRLPHEPWRPPADLNSPILPDAVITPQNTDIPDSSRREGVYTFLLCGLDDDKTRTDTIMVASLDVKNSQLGVVSIPRDTYIPSASRSVKKINGAYGGKNTDRLLDEVKTVVGFRPDYCIILDYEGFVALVDAIGGVDFDVPVNLSVNPYQSVMHKISKGYQHLDGMDALAVVRHREKYAAQDLQRVNVQRDMLKEIAKKTLTPASLLKLPQFKEVIENNLQTGLKWGELAAFALELSKVDLETGLKSGTIPTKTKSGTSYEAVQTGDALVMINEILNPFIRPVTEDDLS